MRQHPTIIALLLVLVAAPGSAAAQGCGLAASPGLALAGGLVHYDLGGGVDGISAGADLAVTSGPLAIRVGYRRMVLEGDAVDPDVVRVTAAAPVLRVVGVDVCATGYAGGARFAVGDDAGLALAGGVGITLARSRSAGPGGITPFITVRGLGAQTTGTVMGFDLDANGLSLGVEGGAAARLGPLGVRLTASLDGFDNGLGTTPFPAQSVELAVAYPF